MPYRLWNDERHTGSDERTAARNAYVTNTTNAQTTFGVLPVFIVRPECTREIKGTLPWNAVRKPELPGRIPLKSRFPLEPGTGILGVQESRMPCASARWRAVHGGGPER